MPRPLLRQQWGHYDDGPGRRTFLDEDLGAGLDLFVRDLQRHLRERYIGPGGVIQLTHHLRVDTTVLNQRRGRWLDGRPIGGLTPLYRLCCSNNKRATSQ